MSRRARTKTQKNKIRLSDGLSVQFGKEVLFERILSYYNLEEIIVKIRCWKNIRLKDLTWNGKACLMSYDDAIYEL